jgi:hypothetical protein
LPGGFAEHGADNTGKFFRIGIANLVDIGSRIVLALGGIFQPTRGPDEMSQRVLVVGQNQDLVRLLEREHRQRPRLPCAEADLISFEREDIDEGLGKLCSIPVARRQGDRCGARETGAIEFVDQVERTIDHVGKTGQRHRIDVPAHLYRQFLLVREGLTQDGLHLGSVRVVEFHKLYHRSQ